MSAPASAHRRPIHALRLPWVRPLQLSSITVGLEPSTIDRVGACNQRSCGICCRGADMDDGTEIQQKEKAPYIPSSGDMGLSDLETCTLYAYLAFSARPLRKSSFTVRTK